MAKIAHRIWSNDKFLRLPTYGKLMALYLVTCQSNRIGLFVVNFDDFDLPGMDLHLFRDVVKGMGWESDENTGVLYIPEWWSYLSPDSEQELLDCLNDIDFVPPNRFLDDFFHNTEYLSSDLVAVLRRFSEARRSLASRSGKGITTTRATVLDNEPGNATMSFPTIGKGGGSWLLTRDQLRGLERLYPNLDVLSECRKALAWVTANPKRRKTNVGMMRFLVNWLNRAAESRSRGRSCYDPRGNMETALRYLAETSSANRSG